MDDWLEQLEKQGEPGIRELEALAEKFALALPNANAVWPFERAKAHLEERTRRRKLWKEEHRHG